MAKDVERMVLELSADVGRLERGMKQAARATESQTRRIERAFENMNKRSSSAASAMSDNIRNAIGGIALAAAVREVQQYADAWTRMQNPLKAAGLGQAEVNAQMDELVQIALRSRSSLEATSTFYNRLTAASQELGLSQKEVLRIVETVNKALATSQLTGGERASAVTQLVQGLGSGSLQGDELKALRENALPLAQAIAKEFGVAVGELKKLGAEGELVSGRVAKALLDVSDSTDTAFARTTATIEDTFTNLQTKVIQFVGQMDQSTGASEKLAAVIGFVADHLEEIATAAGIAAVAVGSAYVAAMTAAAVRTGIATVSALAYQVALIRLAARQSGATAAQIALNAAMAANPIGLVVVAVGALAAGLALASKNYITAAEAAGEMSDRVAENDDILRRYEDAQLKARDASKEHAAAARETAAALREEASAALMAIRALSAERVAAANAKAERATTTANEAAARAAAFGGTGGFSNASAIAMQKAAQDYKTAAVQMNDAQAVAGAAIREQIRMEQEIQRITAGINLGGGASGGGGGGGSGAGGGSAAKRAAGPTPEELERTRQLLTLELQIDRLKAQGREAEAASVQALIDQITLTQRLTDAGVENAAQTAKEQIDAVRLAEAAAKGREEAERRTQAMLDMTIEAMADYNAAVEQQLQDQAELARLAGDETLLRALERELSLRQRIAALGPNATAEQRQAARDAEGRLNSAEDQAIRRDGAADMARTFVDVIRSDDIGAEIGNRFREAAFASLEQFLTDVFTQVMSSQSQGGGGNGGLVGAITQAVGSFFGGKRALGGPVKAGQFYKVNENTPNSEWFAPKQDGWVGNMKTPAATRSSSSIRISQGDIYITGTGDAALRAYVDRALAVSQRQTVQAIKAQAPAAQIEDKLLRS